MARGADAPTLGFVNDRGAADLGGKRDGRGLPVIERLRGGSDYEFLVGFAGTGTETALGDRPWPSN